MRSLFSVFLSCGLILSITACGGGGGSTPSPTPTPTPTPTPGAVNVTPASATLGTSGTQQFKAKDASGATVAVNWTVAGVTGSTSSPGTIDANGNYVAPASAISPKTVTVTATSQTSASASGTATVTITNNAAAQSGAIELGTTGGNSTDSVSNSTAVTCCSGTLGSLVQQGAALLILSNNHVLDKSSFGTIGDPITQPGLVDNNCNPGTVVANLTAAAPLKPTSGTTGASPSNVDAALATIVSGKVDPLGNILNLGTASSSSIAPGAPSSTIAIPANVLAANEGVAKSGRSTGLTCSTLQSISTSVSVQYSSSCGGAVAFTSMFSNELVINGATFSASGDSGSLVVTSDKAEPVGLLFAGNSTSTTANPIQDVFNAFSSGGALSFMSNPDHTVACNAVQQPHSVIDSTVAPSAQEIQRVIAAKNKFSSQLMENPATQSVSIGDSLDNPREGAVVVTVQRPAEIPSVLDGVRTRVIYADLTAARPTVADISRVRAIKEAHAPDMMAQPGIQGVGIGVSDDNIAEPALVIYVIAGMPRPEIPAVIDGLRTKIIEGDRFRAFGWGHETKPSSCAQKQPTKLGVNQGLKNLP